MKTYGFDGDARSCPASARSPSVYVYGRRCGCGTGSPC